MSLTLAVIENPDLYALSFPPPAAAFIVKTIESFEAPDMEARVAQALAEVAQQNSLIAAAFPEQQGVLMTIYDAELSGGGDGFPFLTTLKFVASDLNGLPTLLGISAAAFLPQFFQFKFGLAGDAENLRAQALDAMKRAAGLEDIELIFELQAGAAQGARFMTGLGGIVQVGGPQLRSERGLALRAQIREKARAVAAAAAEAAANAPAPAAAVKKRR